MGCNSPRFLLATEVGYHASAEVQTLRLAPIAKWVTAGETAITRGTTLNPSLGERRNKVISRERQREWRDTPERRGLIFTNQNIMKSIRTSAGIINIEAISHIWDSGDELIIFMIGSPHTGLRIEGKIEVEKFLSLVPPSISTGFQNSINEFVEIAGIKEKIQ